MASDLERLLLRLLVGGMMLLHGIGKLRHGIGGIVEGVAKHGLPHSFAYGVYFGEVLGPVLVLIGLWTRPAALLIAFNMIIAVWLAHSGDLFHLGKGGGYALELQAFYFFGAIAIALVGAGRYAARNGMGQWD